MRTIGIVTVGRSDYGIYRPVLGRIAADPDLRLCLFVGGMHLSKAFGLTVKAIESDRYKICARVKMPVSSDTPEAISKSMGMGLIGFARAYARSRPDILVVLGDRFEMHAAALAALPFNIPVAHIHGGELTQGAIDDALRHSMTKLSHLHFVSTKEYARRVAQLGEEKWRITVSGAPSLDNLKTMPLLNRPALEKKLRVKLSPPPLLVTFHPVTLEYTRAAWQTDELLAAIKAFGRPVIFTLPNSDTGGRVIRAMIEKYVKQNGSASICDNLGTQKYFSLMNLAAAMVGNSSSGIIEAPSLKLPVVNIGSRQGGRVRAKNVIDVGCRREDILAGLRRAISDKFRFGLKGLINPYGDGHAAERIVRRLKGIELNDRLIRKTFQDMKRESYGER